MFPEFECDRGIQLNSVSRIVLGGLKEMQMSAYVDIICIIKHCFQTRSKILLYLLGHIFGFPLPKGKAPVDNG